MTQSNYRITCYFSTGSAHRMMWLQEAVRQTVVHRSFFVEEVVKGMVNNATNFTKIEAGLSLKQMADPAYQARAIEMNYVLKFLMTQIQKMPSPAVSGKVSLFIYFIF